MKKEEDDVCRSRVFYVDGLEANQPMPRPRSGTKVGFLFYMFAL